MHNTLFKLKYSHTLIMWPNNVFYLSFTRQCQLVTRDYKVYSVHTTLKIDYL